MGRTVTDELLARLRERDDVEVTGPGDEGWDLARQAWNLAADQRPALVARPTDVAGVQAVVRAAAAAGVRVAAQATGHGATPLEDLGDAVLLRTGDMASAEVDLDARTARVTGGANWAQVVEHTAPAGLVPLHGSAPHVGVVGYTLGGGLSWLLRSHGLACNAVTAVELVTPDGELQRVDAERDPDLFWALRGGGGALGVVTALEFRLFPLERVHGGWLIWSWDQALPVLSRWAEWTRSVPETVTSIGRILQLPPIPDIPEPLRGRQLVVVEAAIQADEAAAGELLAPLRELSPEMDMFAEMPPIALTQLHQDPEGPVPGIGSHVMAGSLPPQAVEALVEAAGPGSGSALLSVEIRHCGGAAARTPEGAGVLSHIPDEYLYFGVGLPMDPAMGAAIAASGARVVEALAPYGAGRQLLNFAEEPVRGDVLFPPDDHARLRAVRDRVDPDGLMVSNHPV